MLRGLGFRSVFLAVVILSFSLAALTFAAEEGAMQAPVVTPQETYQMSVTNQMTSFDLMIQQVVSAVIARDPKSVLQVVEPALGNMDKVHAALKTGAVKLKKNAGNMKEFDGLETNFQSRLVVLRDAAKKNDQDAILNGAEGVIEACVRCHQKFK